MVSLTKFPHRFASWLQEILIASLSFLVFAFLDCFDRLLCIVFRALDSALDPHITPCYCERGRNPSAAAFESRADGSDLRGLSAVRSSQPSLSLYHRKHLRSSNFSRQVRVGDVPKATVAFPLKEGNVASGVGEQQELSNFNENCPARPNKQRSATLPKIVSIRETLQSEKMANGLHVRWSDCGCSTCTSWHSSGKELLYVRVEGKDRVNMKCSNSKPQLTRSSVIFVHGFLSSSSLWTEEVIPYLPELTKTWYTMYAVDLLGFGKSPKPRNSFYTMADHIEKIRVSVLQPYKIDSFHLVGHSMGCMVALALAAAHSDAVKTITLVAPPYFPSPTDEPAALYMLKQVAPRRIWPPLAFGASVMSWYEHVGRGVCFLVCRHHQIWESFAKLLNINSISRVRLQDFMQHTHHSAWHNFHNVICGQADELDGYLDALERAKCEVHVLHGRDDTLVPVYCSLELHKRYPKVKLDILDGVNHFTIIIGREEEFAHSLAKIWNDAVAF